ncbi:MAG: Gfo/Idh/MocA family oxidoreductase [Clostridiales bacterium]|nr:Gfo/Idh/MocA family oxidoreductase [Clostridiales bacterium]
MRGINVAVIGWGFMGRMHAHALRSIPLMYKNLPWRPVLKLLASGHIENAKRGAQDAGFDEYTDDWTQILSRDDIDAVSICTPNSLHEEMAVRLMEAGKHIYIDKPVSTSYESAKRIYEAWKQSGVKAQAVMNNRFLPAVMSAKRLADEGRIGEILAFSARYLHSGSINPDKTAGWKMRSEGGVILDLASHALDLICHIAGYPEKVMCASRLLYQSRPAKGGGVTDDLGEDYALMLLKMPSGALGSCEASKISTGADDELTVEVRGTRGAVRFDLMDPSHLEYYDNTLPELPLGGRRGFTRIETVGRYPPPAGEFPPPKNAVGWERGHIHCYYSFLDAVYNDTVPPCGLDEALRLQGIMEAARLSCQSGQWETAII